MNAPTKTQQKNILNFAKAWQNGNIVSCKQSYCVARKHLKKFGDWIFANDKEAYSSIVGVIEHANFNERSTLSVKKWKL